MIPPYASPQRRRYRGADYDAALLKYVAAARLSGEPGDEVHFDYDAIVHHPSWAAGVDVFDACYDAASHALQGPVLARSREDGAGRRYIAFRLRDEEPGT